MQRLVPDPPLLALVHRRLARLPLGGPTGLACSIAGAACVIGLLVVGPVVNLPGPFHDDRSIATGGGTSATLAKANVTPTSLKPGSGTTVKAKVPSPASNGGGAGSGTGTSSGPTSDPTTEPATDPPIAGPSDEPDAAPEENPTPEPTDHATPTPTFEPSWRPRESPRDDGGDRDRSHDDGSDDEPEPSRQP